jgi:outer membrane protein assembly factor BamB
LGVRTDRGPVQLLVALTLGSALVATIVAAPAAIASSRGQERPATASVIDIANPDQYLCPEPGWVGFEDVANGTSLGATTVPGLSFTAGGGGPWSVGDYATGTYDGKFPAGTFTSEELHWAWPGASNGNGRIDLIDGAATTFSVLVSNTAPVYLDAYASDNTLLATAGPTAVHPNGVRHMSEMKIDSPIRNIAYAVVRDSTGDPFVVDSLCTDAPGLPSEQLTLTSADGHPNSQTTVSGRGFLPGEHVDVSLDGTFLGQQTANSSGLFSRFVRIAKTASPGEHTIVASGLTSHSSSTADYYVHTDWSQYGYDPAHTGDNPYENTLGIGNASTLHIAWSGITGARATAPAVADGVVYMGSFDGAIYAFNAAQNLELWSTATGGSIGAAPAIDNGLVFTGSGDHKVYAMDAGTGRIVATYATGGSIAKSPLVNKGVVYIGSDDGYMYALNETNLTFKWRTKIGSKLRSAPATDGTNLYFGADDRRVHALNLKTGIQAWETVPTGGLIRSNPAVVDGHVVVGSDDSNVYSFSTTNGAQSWSFSLGEQVRSSPTVAHGVVYVGSNQSAIFALSLATGVKQWQLGVGGPVNEKGAVANGVVYFGVGDGTLVAANASSGANLKTVSIGAGTVDVAGVAVSDGAVYTVANTAEVKLEP